MCYMSSPPSPYELLWRFKKRQKLLRPKHDLVRKNSYDLQNIAWLGFHLMVYVCHIPSLALLRSVLLPELWHDKLLCKLLCSAAVTF